MASNIKLNWEQIFTKGAILAGVRQKNEYINGQRTEKQLGFNHILVNRSGYDKVTVFIESPTPFMTNDEIDASMEDVLVVAEGFVGTVYNYTAKHKEALILIGVAACMLIPVMMEKHLNHHFFTRF